VDFSDFGVGAYAGVSNSVYRVPPPLSAAVCGNVGRATRVTSPSLDTCKIGRSCYLVGVRVCARA
jgi:hypothetical protein